MGEREDIHEQNELPAGATPKKALPAIHAGAAIRALVPTTLDDAFRIARYISVGGHLPKGMETPEQIMVAIMHGLEIGLPPMQAVQSIAVINGRPVVWGDAAMALVRSSGFVETITEYEEGVAYEDTFQAVCEASRKGQGSIRTVFSVADAKKAGLWTKTGPWQQYPRRMLKMRARAFALRDLFADVLRGLAIREEIEDVTMRDVTSVPDASYNPLQPSRPEPSSPPAGQLQEMRASVSPDQGDLGRSPAEVTRPFSDAPTPGGGPEDSTGATTASPGEE